MAYRAFLVALQLLVVCHTGDRVPGRSTWGSPTTNKHPWTPKGSKGGERTAFCALSFACSLESAGLFTRRIRWSWAGTEHFAELRPESPSGMPRDRHSSDRS
jgi:hypothetical protein